MIGDEANEKIRFSFRKCEEEFGTALIGASYRLLGFLSILGSGPVQLPLMEERFLKGR